MSQNQPVIMLTEHFDERAIDRLRKHAVIVRLDETLTGGALARLASAAGLLIRHRTLVSREVIDAAPNLRVIGRGGAGLDNVDIAYAQNRGITIVYTPAAMTAAVAQHTLAMLLALEHRLAEAHGASQRASQFEFFRAGLRFRELRSAVLGVIGMGRIGSAVARICSRGFGMRVLYNDIRPVGPFDFEACATSKEDVYTRADFVTLHVPLTRDTHHLIGQKELARMKPTSALINTCRGLVIDSHALARALADGHIACAALDVFDCEPLPQDHPLLGAPNILLTPHIAAHSCHALDDISRCVVDDVISVLGGRPPRFAVPLAAEAGITAVPSGPVY